MKHIPYILFQTYLAPQEPRLYPEFLCFSEPSQSSAGYQVMLETSTQLKNYLPLVPAPSVNGTVYGQDSGS